MEGNTIWASVLFEEGRHHTQFINRLPESRGTHGPNLAGWGYTWSGKLLMQILGPLPCNYHPKAQFKQTGKWGNKDWTFSGDEG